LTHIINIFVYKTTRKRCSKSEKSDLVSVYLASKFLLVQQYLTRTTLLECSVEMSGSTSSEESVSFRSTIVQRDSCYSVAVQEEQCFVDLVSIKK